MDATTAILGWFRGGYEQEVGRLEISEVISLIEKAKEGDRGAFEALMRAYSGFVYSLAFRMLGGRADAEDVFQETFFRAWSHLNSFRSGENLTHWIKRIATNLCIDRLKHASGNMPMRMLKWKRSAPGRKRTHMQKSGNTRW